MTPQQPHTQNELLKLAERCETATGRDYDLDVPIALAVGYAQCKLIDPEKGAKRFNLCNQFGHKFSPPEYTASLNAATTLVPEGKTPTGERFNVEEWDTNGVHAEHVRATAWVPGAERTYAATPALALTAAALRARANQSSTNLQTLFERGIAP